MFKKFITVEKTEQNTTIKAPGFEYRNGRETAVIGDDFISHAEFTDIDGVHHECNGTYRGGHLIVGKSVLWGYGVPNSEQPLPGKTIPDYPPAEAPIPDDQHVSGTVTQSGWLWIIALVMFFIILIRG